MNRAAVLMALISVAGGCMSTRVKHIYALTEAAEPPMDAKAVATAPVLQLQRVLVPDSLDTTDVVTRVGAHELRASSSGRWGERLSLEITHALRADLAARLPGDVVKLGPAAERSARQILVTVDAFDVWADGRCVLIASWTMVDKDGRATITSGRGTFISPPARTGSPSDGAVVAGMVDAVGQLADGIALMAKALTPGEHLQDAAPKT